MKILKFALSRYSYFFSYVAAFLAGMSIVLPAIYMLIPLGAAALFGSGSAYYRKIEKKDFSSKNAPLRQSDSTD